jgi:hypothetical protein
MFMTSGRLYVEIGLEMFMSSGRSYVEIGLEIEKQVNLFFIGCEWIL